MVKIKIVKLQNEEFTSFDAEFKLKKDDSITVKGLLNIYTDDGTFDADIQVNCKRKYLLKELKQEGNSL